MPRVKTEEKSQTIVDAAARVFLAREFHEVSVDDVAAEAHAGKGTIYRYFPTKEELFFVSVLYGLDTLHESLRVGLREQARPDERLKLIARELLRFAWNRRDLLTTLHRDERLFSRRGAEFVERRQKVVVLIAETIAAGVERGDFRPIDPTAGAEVFLGMLRGLNLYRRPGDLPDDLVRTAIDMLVNGIVRRNDA
jgi:TetR/AcrR family transcriptional regulator, fatty acid metabolism regulator protein